MKTRSHKSTTELMQIAVMIITIGLGCMTGGFVFRSDNRDTCRLWESGKWSVRAVKEFAGIQTDNDIATPRERALFSAATTLNDVGDTFARIDVQASNLVIAIGVCLLYLGGRQVWRVVQIKKLIAEQPPAEYGSQTRRL